MDEYLMKYGFSPLSSGVDRYFKSAQHREKEKQAEDMPHRHKSYTEEMPTKHPSHKMKFSDTMLKDLPLAMAYVPMQKYKDCYSNEEALKAGTLFPELDKPFLGKKEWLK